MTNPLTAQKARQLAEWLDVCDTYVLAFAKRDPEMTPETLEQVVEFFTGNEVQDDLKDYADWLNINYPVTTVKVRGSEGDIYELDMQDGKAVSCTCPGFVYRETCKHLAIAEETR